MNEMIARITSVDKAGYFASSRFEFKGEVVASLYEFAPVGTVVRGYSDTPLEVGRTIEVHQMIDMTTLRRPVTYSWVDSDGTRVVGVVDYTKYNPQSFAGLSPERKMEEILSGRKKPYQCR